VPANLPVLGDGVQWLGLNHYRLGEFALAEQEVRNALSYRQQAYAGEHPVTAKCQANLALVLLPRDKVQEALELSKKAVDANESLYGPAHRETAYAEDSLGLSLLASGRANEARQVFESDLKARFAVFPSKHIQIARTWMFLAMTDYALQNLPLAAEECRKGLEILDSVHGPHALPLQAELDAVMIELLAAQHQFKQAEEYGTLSAASFQKSLPPNNPRMAAIQSALGSALASDGKFDQAAPLLRQALAIDQQTYGAALSQTAQTGIRLAACLQESGQTAESDALVRKYRAILADSPNAMYRAERHWLNAHAAQANSSQKTAISQVLAR
jgi:tetratricopeptide (TPR) repeat protein